MNTANRTPLALSRLALFAPQLAEEDQDIETALDITPESRLSEFFEQYFVPVYLKSRRADPRTIDEYYTAVRRWMEITGDPPLLRITNKTCAHFVAREYELLGRKGETLSPNTIRKHCGALQLVLHLAGPACESYKEAPTAYGLFGLDPYGRPRMTPYFSRPEKRDKLPEDFFTLEEIRLWIASAKAAEKPISGLFTPEIWWNSLIRFLYNSGLRIGSALKIRREWICRGEGFFFLQVPGKVYKQGRPHLFYLSQNAIAALEPMPKSGLLFPWVYSPKCLQDHRKKLLALAELPLERRFGFHGLRKALGTFLWGVNRNAAKLQLGHEDEATTESSYAGQEVWAKSLAAAVGPHIDRLPQP